jgi:hypothetical protein
MMCEEYKEVDQGDSVYEVDSGGVGTYGLGPCIAVAIVYAGKISITHQPASHLGCGFDEFLKTVEMVVPLAFRSEIYPIVAGGKVGDDLLDEVLESRGYVLFKLNESGFAAADTYWCSNDAEGQSLVADVENRTVEVETQWQGKPAQVEVIEF